MTGEQSAAEVASGLAVLALIVATLSFVLSLIALVIAL